MQHAVGEDKRLPPRGEHERRRLRREGPRRQQLGDRAEGAAGRGGVGGAALADRLAAALACGAAPTAGAGLPPAWLDGLGEVAQPRADDSFSQEASPCVSHPRVSAQNTQGGASMTPPPSV